MMEKDLAALVAKAVAAEVRTHTDDSLSEAKLALALEPLLFQALPKALEQKMALLEPLIQRSLADIAGPLIQERIEQFVAEQNAARYGSRTTRIDRGTRQGRDPASCRQADSGNGRRARSCGSPRADRRSCSAAGAWLG